MAFNTLTPPDEQNSPESNKPAGVVQSNGSETSDSRIRWTGKGLLAPITQVESDESVTTTTAPHFSRENFELLCRTGQYPSCVIPVKNEDGKAEDVFFQGSEWGTVVVALQKMKSKMGRITSAVVNQSTRTIYITGPGLPATGLPLRIVKAGFRDSLYHLEDTFRKSGLKFNFRIAGAPDKENVDIELLLEDISDPLENLPRCQHSTDVVMLFVRRYAEARADAPLGMIDSYVDQLRVEGIAIENSGDQWMTKDGRKGPIPWINRDRDLQQRRRSTGVCSSPSPAASRSTGRRGSSSSPHPAPSSSPPQRGRSAIPWSQPRAYSAPRIVVPKRSASGTGRYSRPQTPSRQPTWRPSGTSSYSFSAFESESGYSHTATPRSRRITAEKVDANHLTEQFRKQLAQSVQSPQDTRSTSFGFLVGPTIVKIPPGCSLTVMPDSDLKPLHVGIQQGGRVVKETHPVPSTSPHTKTSVAVLAATDTTVGVGFSHGINSFERSSSRKAPVRGSRAHSQSFAYTTAHRGSDAPTSTPCTFSPASTPRRTSEASHTPPSTRGRTLVSL